MLRFTTAAIAFAALALPAKAGGYDCGGDCYRQVHVPARYETAVEPALLRGPRTYALVTPAEYRTVHERVVVEPARRIWTVRYDGRGDKIGCWVETPARYATVARRVMVRAPTAVPYAQTASWGLRSYPVLAEPAHRAWFPIGERE